jgi:carbon storage regulator
MLVLSRKINETVLIGGDVRVTVLAIEGDRVKLGVEAPRDVRVFREEVLAITRETNREALDAPIGGLDLANLKDT